MSLGRTNSDRRSDYKDRVRTTRERVEAAAAAAAANKQHADSRPSHAGASALRVGGTGQEPRQGMQGRPQAAPQVAPQVALRNQRLLPPQSSRSGDQTRTGAAPPRPHRPDNTNSWFSTGAAGASASVYHPAEQGFHRGQVPSYAPTESIYSQAGVGDDTVSAPPSRSSYATHTSSISSIGDIPDFPVHEDERDQAYHQPQVQIQPPPQSYQRRVPPRVARRGTSSYYSHQSFVSPIPEESPQSTPRHGLQSMDFTQEGILDPVDETVEQSILQDPSDEGKPNTADGGGHEDDRGDSPLAVVRQASIGKKAKPTVTLVRSRSSGSKKGISPPDRSASGTPVSARASSTIGLGVNTGDAYSREPPVPLSSLTSPLPTPDGGQGPSVRSTSPHAPVMEQILGGLEKGGALPGGVPVPVIAAEPPREHQHVAAQDDRISASSLTELIRRATTVRTNLDHGKTASRFGMLDMFGKSKERLGGYPEKGDRSSTSDSISGMIGWFPPPTESPGPNHLSRFGQDGYFADQGDEVTHEIDGKNEKRRCCGMPQWLFVMIIVLIVVCVAAAIMVPVELLVVPHQVGHGLSTATLATCPSSHACQNAGVSVVFNSTCACACVDGFTGTTCQNAPDAACASDSSGVSSTMIANMTFGSAVPLLIEGSQVNFSVNLNATALSAAFAVAGFSCSDENGLMTFRGKAAGKRNAFGLSIPASAGGWPVPTPAPSGAPTLVPELRRDITSDGILLVGPTTTSAATSLSTPTTGSGIATGTPPALAPASASASASSTSSSVSAPTTQDVDFARVAVLWILEQAGMSVAQAAHDKLDSILSAGMFLVQSVNVTDTVTVDFSKGTVEAGNVTVGTGFGVPQQ